MAEMTDNRKVIIPPIRKPRNIGGRPRAPIWDFFTQGQQKSGGHYVAVCKFCGQKWQRGKPYTLKAHLALICEKVPDDVRQKQLDSLTEAEMQRAEEQGENYVPTELFRRSTDFTPQLKSPAGPPHPAPTSTQNISAKGDTSGSRTGSLSAPPSKKIKSEYAEPIPTTSSNSNSAHATSSHVRNFANVYHSSTTDFQRNLSQSDDNDQTIDNDCIKGINRSLMKAFIVCGIPFSLVENPFFIDFVKELKLSYDPPSCQTITTDLLRNEAATVTNVMKSELSEQTNLTLCLGAPINCNNESFPYFQVVISTQDRKEYLWKLRNSSNTTLTATLISDIDDILSGIGSERFAAIVTDNSIEACTVGKDIAAKYSNIIPIRSIDACVNSITRDICRHEFVRKVLGQCQIVYSFFTKDVHARERLREAAEELKIQNHSLLPFNKHQWSTFYDMTSSIVRLCQAFRRALSSLSAKTVTERVREILKDENFFTNADRISTILFSLKQLVNSMETKTSTMADSYVLLGSLASAINSLPVMYNVGFKNDCIKIFNNHFATLDNELYLLAFFLNPKYRGEGTSKGQFRSISMSAARLWQKLGNDQNSCQTLITQLREYKEHKAPFDMVYNDIDTPAIWWFTAELPQGSEAIQELALLLYAITPYAAASSQSTVLQSSFRNSNQKNVTTSEIENEEETARLCSYYASNLKKELNHYNVNKQEASIRAALAQSITSTTEEPDDLTEEELDSVFGTGNPDDEEEEEEIGGGGGAQLNIATIIDLESENFKLRQTF